MAENGKIRPPRPRLVFGATVATPDEAAAIASALERFLIDTAPPPEKAPVQSAWLRAALREGTSAHGLGLGLGDWR